MKHHTQARYPASSDVVIRMFSNREFHERKMNNLGLDFEILDEGGDDGEFRLKTRRAVPVDAKGVAAKFMPSTTQVVNDERWRASDKTGAVTVETRGVPLEMRCTAKMRDDGDACVIDYDWHIKAKIPVGGGALEKFVVKDMEKRQAQEHEAGIALLDDYR